MKLMSGNLQLEILMQAVRMQQLVMHQAKTNDVLVVVVGELEL